MRESWFHQLSWWPFSFYVLQHHASFCPDRLGQEVKGSCLGIGSRWVSMVPFLLHRCCHKASIASTSASSSAAARLIPSLSQQAATVWVCLFYPAVIRTLCIQGGSRIGTWFHRLIAFAHYQLVLLLLLLALILWTRRTLRGWVRLTAPALPLDLLCFLLWHGILLLFRPQLAGQAQHWTCFWRCFLHWRLLLSITMVFSSCRYVFSLFFHGTFWLLPTGQIHRY